MLILLPGVAAAQKREELLHRLPESAVVVERQAVRWRVARGALKPLGDLRFIFPTALLQTLAQHVRRDLQADRQQGVGVARSGLRQMRAGAVGHHVETGVQPEVNFDANAVVIIIGVPAQRKKLALGAAKKLLLAEGDMVLAPGVKGRVI